MERVIITGANGFLGAALTRLLARKGIEVLAIVREGAENTENLSGINRVRVIECALSDIPYFDHPLERPVYDAFYHFAWAGTSGKARQDAGLQLSNIHNTCEALKASARLGCKKFIFAGSVMAFSCMNQMPQENPSPSAAQVYGVAKLAARFLGSALAEELGIPFVEAVIGNVYGPGERSERFVNATLRKLLCGEPVSFTDGEQLYDFLYIDDAAGAFAFLGEWGRDQQSYYIGNIRPRPLKAFIEEIHACAGPDAPLVLGGLESPKAPLTYEEFDMEKICRELGFTSEVPFKEGIRRTADWLRKQIAEENNHANL